MADTKKLLKNKYILWLWPLSAALLGLLIRLSFITKSSIWHDEGFSIMLARRTSAQIWAGSARDVHPPGYYELLHLWMKLFGQSELAVRSLSTLAGVLIIPLGYVIVKKIAGLRAAILASFLLALAPFLIRYSQEARMYGVLGLFLLIALYAVIEIVERPKRIWPYVVYALAVVAGLYTHYFTVLAVAAFWLYLLSLLLPSRKAKAEPIKIILSLKWWLANIVAAIIFLPWVPTLISQLSRGQGLSWLSKASIHSFQDAIWQFFTFTDARQLFSPLYWLIPLVILAAAIYISQRDKSRQHFTRLLEFYSFLPILIALMVSLQKPIFHERYFAFAAVGIYLIIAIAIDRLAGKRTWLFASLAALVIITEIVGIRNVYTQANHQMSVVMTKINQAFRPEDKLIAGELYVYFDGSYYNSTGRTLMLYTAESPPNGYGESGLLYDKDVYLDSYSVIGPGSRVWLLGKTGDHDYYSQIPANWRLLSEKHAGYSEIRLYEVK